MGDIAGGVHVGKDDLDVGAGDQGIMFGYASDETEDCMPLTHSMATRLGKKLTDVRKSGKLWWLRPDGKTQVTIEYLQKADGSVEPQKFHTIVISTQHAEPSKAVRTKECAGYSGPEMTAPSMEEMNKLIVEEVVKKTLSEIKLKNGEAALTLFGDHTHLHINPSGKFIIGGPQGDAGLTGRKIIIDTYGGWGAHGGGAFSGKDPTKVDRSAAYICRQMAKSIVKSGLSSVPWCSSLTRLALRSLCHCLWRLTALSAANSLRRISPTSLRSSLTVVQALSPSRWPCASQNIRRLLHIATSVANHIRRMARNSSSGRTQRTSPSTFLWTRLR